MIEKLIVLEDIDPVIFYGVNNANIQLIKALYPKLRIVARGNVIKVLGDEEEMCAFEENITKLEKYCAEYNSLKEEVIIDIIKGNAPQAEQNGNVIVFSVTGKPIIPRSENQLKLVEGFAKNDMVFAIGPAGSGKTYTAIALAVRALKNKEIKKIILSRPAVEAGDRPVSATVVRCIAGYDTRHQVKGIHGAEHYTDCSVSLYARTHAE